MKKTLTMAMLFVAALTSSAAAAEDPPPQLPHLTVKQVMCSLPSKQCTAFFDVNIDKNVSCVNKSRVRWDASTPAGQNMLSLFQAAHLSGKQVIVTYDGCIPVADNKSDPQLQWAQVL